MKGSSVQAYYTRVYKALRVKECRKGYELGRGLKGRVVDYKGREVGASTSVIANQVAFTRTVNTSL